MAMHRVTGEAMVEINRSLSQRYQSAENTSIDAESAANLKLQWTYGFSSQAPRSYPLVTEDTIFIGDDGYGLVALDRKRGCTRWVNKDIKDIGSSISATNVAGRTLLILSGRLTGVFAVDAKTGKTVWNSAPKVHPVPMYSGSPLIYEDKIYLPISSQEIALSANPFYGCCTTSGGLAALDVKTGALHLIDLFNLELLDTNLYRSRFHRENHQKNLYGGQVLGQSLAAACLTCDDRLPHSVHGYFLRPGVSDVPVIYDVDPTRDGGSFTTRRVVAKQNGRPIFHMPVSFHIEEEGFEHADLPIDMPPLPTDEDILRVSELQNSVGLTPELIEVLPNNGLIDLVPCASTPFYDEAPAKALGKFWIRSNEALPDNSALQNCALAFASDISLLATSVFPHPITIFDKSLMPASIDHALWLHRQTDLSNWHLYETESPWAGGARGFNRGEIFDSSGRLIASVAQEGLIRRL